MAEVLAMDLSDTVEFKSKFNYSSIDIYRMELEHDHLVMQ